MPSGITPERHRKKLPPGREVSRAGTSSRANPAINPDERGRTRRALMTLRPRSSLDDTCQRRRNAWKCYLNKWEDCHDSWRFHYDARRPRDYDCRHKSNIRRGQQQDRPRHLNMRPLRRNNCRWQVNAQNRAVSLTPSPGHQPCPAWVSSATNPQLGHRRQRAHEGFPHPALE